MIPNKLKPFLVIVIGYFVYKNLKQPAKKARKLWYDSEKPFNDWYEKDYNFRYGINKKPKLNKSRKRPIIKVKNKSNKNLKRALYSPNTKAMRDLNKQFN